MTTNKAGLLNELVNMVKKEDEEQKERTFHDYA